jgi:COP9 signalosome complex subunit 3
MFTSHHLPLVELAYHTGHVDSILPVISKSIVFYPGMRGQTETRPLCDTRLPPSAYISAESGLTARVTSTTVLRYDMVTGLAHLSKRDWASASAAFERVCTFPTRDFGCSRIMTDAYGKWVLTGLLLAGKLRSWPPTAQGAMTQAVLRSFAAMGKPYVALAKAFEKGADEGGPDELREAFEAGGGEAFWAGEENLGLVREVLAHYQRHHILRLREVYAKISLEDIRLQTHSGETGGPLGSAAEIEALLREMIASGMLAGVVEKPEGAAEGDGQGHLTFLSEGEELSESRFAAEIAASARRIADLAPVVEATNERLGTSRDYVRYIAKEQRKEKESASGGLTAHVGGGGGVGYKDSMFDMGFDSQIEDEDLMTGLLREGGS